MPLYTMRSGVELHPEDTVLQHLTDMVRKSGVLDPASDLLVVEPAGGGLNVDVGSGRCFAKKTDTNSYPARNTSTETVAISANSSGNPRIDSIVLYIDLSVIPGSGSTGTGIAKLASVEGTPASSPSAPNESQIESAIGSANPYVVLADIAVANGATGISTANITQVAKRVFMKTPKPTFEIEYSATISPDYNDGDEQEVLLDGGNLTVNAPSNMQIGEWFMLKLTQDATGGRSVTWFSGITWMSADYSINTSADAMSKYAFKKTGASSYEGYLVGKEY